MVTVTDILGKCKIDKLIDKFVFYVHNNMYFDDNIDIDPKCYFSSNMSS